MKLLVTGAAGFIGSNLSERLLIKGFSVVGLDNFDNFYGKEIKERNLKDLSGHSNFEFIECDLKNADALKAALDHQKIEVVVHLAAKAGVRPSIRNPLGFIADNIIATQNLLDWMNHMNLRKIVFASSSSVYGNNKVPFSESDPVDHPISPYAFTKKSCELLTYNYHHLFGFDVVNLRFFTAYGPRQRPDLAIHKFFSQIYKNEAIEMYGDGSTGRDYTFVDDIVDGIISAVKYVGEHQKIYEIINIGNNSPVTLKELIETIGEVTSRKILIKRLPMQDGDVDHTFANIDKARQLLNYSPQILLKDGLAKFRDWFEANYHLTKAAL